MLEVTDKNVLIDPSLILARNSVINTYDSIRKFSETGKGYKFYYPSSLKILIEDKGLSKKIPAVAFFLHNADLIRRKEFDNIMLELSNNMLPFKVNNELMDKHIGFYKKLTEELEYRGELRDKELLSILFEEWVFLQEYSWMVSRIKKSLNRFASAGTIFLQIGRRALDSLVGLPLRPEQRAFIDDAERLKALGKWIIAGISASILAPTAPYLAFIPAILIAIDPDKNGQGH